jgi:hypothetical protein
VTARDATPWLLAAALVSAQPGEWTPAGVKSGVVLHFRDVRDLDAREVRAVAELPHAADRIVSLVCDFTHNLDPDVREAKLLSGDVASRYEIYLRYAPRYMLVAARDVVIEVRREPSGCSWSDVADRVPPREGTVRMPLLRGSWSVERRADAQSRVTYQVTVRPGGRIPAWLVRRGAVDALPDIIARAGRRLAGG